MKNRDLEPFNKTFALTALSIDLFSEELEDLLTQTGVERQNRLRIRLSLEEALLRLRDRFGEEQRVGMSVRNSVGRVTITLETEGDAYNPLSSEDVELEDWSSSLLTAVGLSPRYSYAGRKNTLRLVLPKPPMNPLLKFLIAVVGGMLIGFLRGVVPAGIPGGYAVTFLLDNAFDLWLRILQLIAGPVIFFMVTTTVLNTRKLNEMGGNRRSLTVRYLVLSIVIAGVSLIAAVLCFAHAFAETGNFSGEVTSALTQLLDLVPADIVTPFVTADTPQLLIMALAVGKALNVIGQQAGTLRKFIRQVNMAGLLLTESVSRLMPFFTCILVGVQVWDRGMLIFSGLWKCAVLFLFLTVFFMTAVLLYVSRREKVPFSVLIKKISKPFLMTIRSGSLDASFGQAEMGSVQELGIEKRFARLGMTYGLLLYMPASAAATITFTVYAAVTYGAAITPLWCVLTVVYSVVMFVATPPVPGANVLAYVAIFGSVGISKAAIVPAMVFDLLSGVLATAANETLLQLDMILQAERLGLLDKEKLQKINKGRGVST